jgi:hypothetical protein
VTLRRVLVELSVAERRYQAVLQVLAGASVTEVAGCSGSRVRLCIGSWAGTVTRGCRGWGIVPAPGLVADPDQLHA